MSCSSCSRNRNIDGYKQPVMLDFPPHGAKDAMIISNGNKEKITQEQWVISKHKLLIFTENVSEVDAADFDGLVDYNIQPYIVSAYSDEEIDTNTDTVLRLTSYILPARLNLIYNGTMKKAIVFVKDDSSTIIQDYFENMNFNMKNYIENIKTYIGGESVSLTQE